MDETAAIEMCIAILGKLAWMCFATCSYSSSVVLHTFQLQDGVDSSAI